MTATLKNNDPIDKQPGAGRLKTVHPICVLTVKIVIVVVGVLATSLLIWEIYKLTTVESRDREYIARHVTANEMLNTCGSLWNIVTTIKDETLHYEQLLNKYAISGQEADKEIIELSNKKRLSMVDLMNEKLDVLTNRLHETADLLPDSFRITRDKLVELKRLIEKYIKDTTISEPARYVLFDGLSRYRYSELI
jgi:hypothetical protein